MMRAVAAFPSTMSMGETAKMWLVIRVGKQRIQ